MKKLFLVILLIPMLLLTSCNSDKVTLPDFEGVEFGLTLKTLDTLNLIYAIKYEESELEEYTIIRTVPEAGTELEPYSRVELYVAQ